MDTSQWLTYQAELYEARAEALTKRIKELEEERAFARLFVSGYRYRADLLKIKR